MSFLWAMVLLLADGSGDIAQQRQQLLEQFKAKINAVAKDRHKVRQLALERNRALLTLAEANATNSDLSYEDAMAIGLCFEINQQYESTERFARSAIASNPQSKEAYTLLCRSLLNTNQHDEVLALVDRITSDVRADHDFRLLNRFSFEAHRHQGEHAAAVKRLMDYLEIRLAVTARFPETDSVSHDLRLLKDTCEQHGMSDSLPAHFARLANVTAKTTNDYCAAHENNFKAEDLFRLAVMLRIQMLVAHHGRDRDICDLHKQVITTFVGLYIANERPANIAPAFGQIVRDISQHSYLWKDVQHLMVALDAAICDLKLVMNKASESADRSVTSGLESLRALAVLHRRRATLVGEEPMAIHCVSEAGKTVCLATDDGQGRVVMLYFWSPFSQEASNHLNELRHVLNTASENVEFYLAAPTFACSWDAVKHQLVPTPSASAEDSAKALTVMLRACGINSRVLLVDKKALADYAVGIYPQVVFISPDNKIDTITVGSRDSRSDRLIERTTFLQQQASAIE